jgi:hypothetical protein
MSSLSSSSSSGFYPPPPLAVVPASSSVTKKLRDEEAVPPVITAMPLFRQESGERLHSAYQEAKEDAKRWWKDEMRRVYEEVRRDYEEARRDEEIALRENKIRRLEKENARRDRKFKFDEWTIMNTSIRDLRLDLCNPIVDEDEKVDIKREIGHLKRRRHELAVELGIAKK